MDERRGEEEMVDVHALEKHGPKASWWYQKAERGEVPSYKLGKYRLFKPSEIEQWIAAQRQGPR